MQYGAAHDCPATRPRHRAGRFSRAVTADLGYYESVRAAGGPDAEAMLAVGCPLDLHPSAFPVGMCTRTVFAKCEMVLWRKGPALFHIEVWRSFRAYVVSLLELAGEEFTGRGPHP